MNSEELINKFLSSRIGKSLTVETINGRKYTGVLQDFSMSALLLKTSNSPIQYIMLMVDTILSISFWEEH